MFAQRNEVRRIEFQLRMQPEWISVMNLQFLDTTTSCTRWLYLQMRFVPAQCPERPVAA